MDITKYISDLLYRYDCVIIPGFGGFITNKIGAKLDEKKHRILTLLEIYLQIGLVAVSTYIMREYVEAVFKTFFKIEKKPGRFSALIIAPTLFSQMPTLMSKLQHIWKI